MVYIKSSQESWNRYSIRGTRLVFHSSSQTFHPNSQSVPMGVYKLANDTLNLTRTISNPIQLPSLSTPVTTWTSFLKQQEQWIQELIQNTFYDHIMDVIGGIQTAPSLLAVSDGSAKQQHMTFGWVISKPDGTRLVKGYGRCNDQSSSMRAEACLLYTSPSPRDQRGSRMPSSA